MADTKQILLLKVQDQEVYLDEEQLDPTLLPKYRDMMQRLASDPVGQTLVFELIMRLLFIHVLGIRPERLQNRRRASQGSQKRPYQWCTDGVAASATGLGIFG